MSQIWFIQPKNIFKNIEIGRFLFYVMLFYQHRTNSLILLLKRHKNVKIDL